MMLKKSNKLQLHKNRQSLLIESSLPKGLQVSDIKRLFQPPYRQMFELEYLYSSPLCTYYPPFVEVIKMLQNFNAETISFELSQPKVQNPIKIICMRFIYREMLSIAVMDKNEILKNDYASKLRNWYYELSEKHSFLQGINFKKRRADEDKLDEMIRRSYVSNVFDEIDDYLRKRLSFEDCAFDKTFQKENFFPQKRKTTDESQSVNLPLIDIQLYKRQEEILRKHRQKQVQSKYFHEIRVNKNKMRQVSLNNIKSRQFKDSIAMTEHKVPNSFYNSFHGVQNSLKDDKINKSSKNLIRRFDITGQLDWRKRPSQIEGMIEKNKSKSRLNLININGINLIHSKFE